MTIPTVQEVNDFKTDLDDAEAIVNGTTTVTTRLGGDKESLTQLLAKVGLSAISAYNPATTYTDVDVGVEESGVVYRPLPSALPIGPEAFDSANWIVVQGWGPASKLHPHIDTVANMAALGTVVEGSRVVCEERGNATFEVKTGLTANGFDIIQSTANPLFFFELVVDGLAVNAKGYGQFADNSTDDQDALQAALDSGYHVQLSHDTSLLGGNLTSNRVLTMSEGQYLTGQMTRVSAAKGSRLKVDNSSWAASFDPVFITQPGNGRLADLYIEGTSKKGVGVKIQDVADEYSFSGNIQQENLIIEGFYCGMFLNSAFNMDMHNIYITGCSYGLYIDPPYNGGDNGYVTTTNLSGIYSDFNDVSGIEIIPTVGSKTICLDHMVCQRNNQVSGDYQMKVENISAQGSHCYWEGGTEWQAPAGRSEALRMVNSTLVFENSIWTDTGTINLGSGGNTLVLRECTMTGAFCGIEGTGAGLQHVIIEKSDIQGTFDLADGTLLTIIDSNVGGTYYEYYTSLRPTFGPWVSNVPRSDTLRGQNCFTFTVPGSTTVGANSTLNLISDYAMSFAGAWSENCVGTAQFRNAYEPGLILTVWPRSSGADDYINLTVSNTTGSGIDISGKLIIIQLQMFLTATAIP